MTLRYAESDFACKECGSTRLEYDEALRGGLLQGSSVPSGSLLPVLAFPGLGSREGFLPREGGDSPQDNKFCCLTCGTVHDCWDPLGLSSIDEVRGFGFSVPGVPLLFFCFPFGDQERVFFF